MVVSIRDAGPADEAAFRRLWAEYLEFYETELDEETTTATWRRILDPASTVGCRVAVDGGTMVGFAVTVLHEGSWVTQPICYLEDLYVDPSARGLGIGRALIEDLATLGAARGWSRLYWHTRESNTAARRLYDRFAAADGFVRYGIPLR